MTAFRVENERTTMEQLLVDLDTLVVWLKHEGFAGSAEDLSLARDDPARAREIATEAADKIDRYGYRNGQAIGTAHELRRFANFHR